MQFVKTPLKYLKRSSVGSSGIRTRANSLSTALPEDADAVLTSSTFIEVRVKYACRLAAVTICKGANTATFREAKANGTAPAKRILLLITVSGIVLVASSNKELLEMLNYDTAAAASVLVNDETTEILAAVPLNRVHLLQREGCLVNWSYLAHTTFVHVGKLGVLNAVAKATTANPLKKALGDEYMHSASLDLQTDEQAAETLRHIKQAAQRFLEGLRWLSLRFPLSTRVVPLVIVCGKQVIAQQPSFATPFLLPKEWDTWVRSPKVEHQVVDILVSSPIGPVCCSLRASTVHRLLDAHSETQSIVVKVRAQTDERYCSDTPTPSDPNTPDSSAATQASVAWPEQPNPGAPGPQTRPERPLAHTTSMTGLDMEEHSQKFVVMHLKLNAQRAPAFVQDDPQEHPTRHKHVRDDSVPGSPVMLQERGPLDLHTAMIVSVTLLITLFLAWLSLGAARTAATGLALLQVAVLAITGLAGMILLSSKGKSHGSAAAVARPLSHVVKQDGVGAQRVQSARWQWSIEVLHAQVVQVAPDEAEMLPKASSMNSAETSGTLHMVSLTETRPVLDVNLKQEFDELMQQCPSWVTQDIITRYIKGMGSEPVAYSCLMATVQWREEFGADMVLQRPVPAYKPFKALAPHSIRGPSKDGSAVIFFKAGEAAIQFPEILAQAGGISEAERYLVWVLEYCIHKDPRPWPAGKFHVVVDLAGVSMMHFAGIRLKCMQACLKIFEKHYKERLGCAVVTNAPGWWGFIYKLMTPLLPAAILEKIQLTTNVKDACTALEKLLPRQEIPQEYGGDSQAAFWGSSWDVEKERMIEKAELNAGQ